MIMKDVYIVVQMLSIWEYHFTSLLFDCPFLLMNLGLKFKIVSNEIPFVIDLWYDGTP